MTAVQTTVRSITAAETRPLRQEILRPHQRIEDLVYDGDHAPETKHFGAFQERNLVGIASIYCDPPGPTGSAPRDRSRCFRLRGMAVRPELRGTGIGGLLLEACLAHIRKQGGAYFWCNARLTAQRFYENHGFIARGEVFELPGIGPHVFMERVI
jgi:predicted GNAT family N-acyltransferase